MSIIVNADSDTQRLDYVGVNYDFQNNPATISLWICAFRTTGTQNIFRQRSSGADADYVRLYINTSGYLIFTMAGIVGNRTRSTSTTVAKGSWNHICVTYPYSKIGSDIDIYVNGIKATYTTTADITTNQSPITGTISLGGRPDNLRNFMGMITCVGCWSRVLSYNEILQLYGGTDPYRTGYGLVHQFPLNNNYRDVTGGSNPTNYGAALSIFEPRCLRRNIPPCYFGISAGVKSVFGHTGYGPIGSRLIRGAA